MDESDFNSSKTGVLLLSHGSRLPDGKKVIEYYLDLFKNKYPSVPVEYAFMEIREPNIPQAMTKLTAENNLEKVIVVPVFVAHGLHTKRDIPKILGIKVDEDIDNHHDHDHGHHHHDHDHDHGHHHHHHDIEKVDFDGEIVLTDPLGEDTRLFEIIEDRIFDNL